MKKKMCKKNDIKLIVIWEKDWIDDRVNTKKRIEEAIR